MKTYRQSALVRPGNIVEGDLAATGASSISRKWFDAAGRSAATGRNSVIITQAGVHPQSGWAGLCSACAMRRTSARTNAALGKKITQRVLVKNAAGVVRRRQGRRIHLSAAF